MLGLCHKNLPVTLLIRKEDKHFDINKYISEGYVILSGEEMYRTALSRRVAKLNANPANLRGGELYPVDPTELDASYPFEFSDDEIIEIARQKVKNLRDGGARYACFLHPHCVETNYGKGRIVEFVSDYDCSNHPVTTQYEFKTFAANIIYDSGARCNGDEFLTRKLVELMKNKYPLVYEHIYIREMVKFYSHGYDIGWDFDERAEKLNKALSYIGKQAKNAEDLIFYGVDKLQYTQLKKLRPGVEFE